MDWGPSKFKDTVEDGRLLGVKQKQIPLSDGKENILLWKHSMLNDFYSKKWKTILIKSPTFVFMEN
jgi:hypothetical protein